MSPGIMLAIQYLAPISITTALVSIFPPNSLLKLFIVLGQAHFILTYIYQWRSGKINIPYFLLYAVAFAALFSLTETAESFYFIIVFTGAIFLMHMLQDERRMRGESGNPLLLPLMTSVVLLGSGLVMAMGLKNMTASFVPLMLQISAVVVYISTAIYAFSLFSAIREWVKKDTTPSALGGVLLVAYPAAFLLRGFVQENIPLIALLGSLILFHFFRWYFYFYFEKTSVGQSRNLYLTLVLSINALVIGLYAGYLFIPETKIVLQFFFTPFYFFIWTALHILFTVRKAEYRLSV